MFKSREVKRAMKFYNLVMSDAEMLKGFFYETDIWGKYLMLPDLAMVPRLSLILFAVYDSSLRLKFGAETSFVILHSSISTLSSMLREGKYMNNPDELFKFYMLSVNKEVWSIGNEETNAEALYSRLVEFTFRFIYGDAVEIENYPGLVNKLKKEFQNFVRTISSRV